MYTIDPMRTPEVTPKAYGFDRNGYVYLTGHRFTGEIAGDIRVAYGKAFSTLTALDITLLHAVWEADVLCEWSHMVAHLTPELRTRAYALGIID